MAKERHKDIEKVGKNVLKRKRNRVHGVFIDGTSLDRATKRMQKRIDLPALVKGVSSGTTPVVARYYTLIPYEDDSRQRAFLDAVRRSGLQVVVTRLPPKNITRQVTINLTMASDMVAFGLGHQEFKDIGYNFAPPEENHSSSQSASEESEEIADLPEHRIVTAVCPARDMSYAFSLLSSFEVETVAVDFGQPSGNELLKACSKWIDIADSETIWKED